VGRRTDEPTGPGGARDSPLHEDGVDGLAGDVVPLSSVEGEESGIVVVVGGKGRSGGDGGRARGRGRGGGRGAGPRGHVRGRTRPAASPTRRGRGPRARRRGEAPCWIRSGAKIARGAVVPLPTRPGGAGGLLQGTSAGRGDASSRGRQQRDPSSRSATPPGGPTARDRSKHSGGAMDDERVTPRRRRGWWEGRSSAPPGPPHPPRRSLGSAARDVQWRKRSRLRAHRAGKAVPWARGWTPTKPPAEHEARPCAGRPLRPSPTVEATPKPPSPPPSSYDLLFKLVLIGDSGVGESVSRTMTTLALPALPCDPPGGASPP